MIALGTFATIMFWTASCGMVLGAYLALTGETVIDKGRWGRTEQVDHRSHSRTNVLDRTHDRDDF